MLTDFDLSKGSNPPGNPTVVKSNSPNVVYIFIYFCIKKKKTYYVYMYLQAPILFYM